VTASANIEDLIRQIAREIAREEIKASLADLKKATGPEAPLSIQDAARRIGMSVGYVRKRIAKGVLPSVKQGNRHRIDPRDLERLRSQEKSSGNVVEKAQARALEKLGVKSAKR
jgi:excisionase family DNA binding protein